MRELVVEEKARVVVVVVVEVEANEGLTAKVRRSGPSDLFFLILFATDCTRHWFDKWLVTQQHVADAEHLLWTLVKRAGRRSFIRTQTEGDFSCSDRTAGSCKPQGRESIEHADQWWRRSLSFSRC